MFHQIAILIRGGGDIATGIALRLYRSGFRRLGILETARPLAVRRQVAFSEAVYEGCCTVEGVTAALAANLGEMRGLLDAGCIPVLIDPAGIFIPRLRPDVLIEATLAKRNVGVRISDAPLVIGVGPGFTAGQDVHCVIETNRGHSLGRVLHTGSAEPDTGIPSMIDGVGIERVLRAPQGGVFMTQHDIGDSVRSGDTVASVTLKRDGCRLRMDIPARIDGVLRGLLRSGTLVNEGCKVGDIDPRFNVACHLVSDKAFAVGGGVLEAILERFNAPCQIHRGVLRHTVHNIF